MLHTWVLIGLFAPLGAWARWGIGLYFGGWKLISATFLVNCLGSMLAGIMFWGLVQQKFVFQNESFHQGIAVGFLGALTTFSALSVEQLKWLQQGRWDYFAINGLGQLGLGVAFCYLGYKLASL